MSLSMHSVSVPLLTQMLTALSGVLKKAEAHAAARRIEPSVLLEYRLAADMFPLRRQVQIACDFAKGTAGRLAGAREIVLRPGTEKEQRFDGRAYLVNYAIPQFLFHVTTAYAILRHAGVDVGKKDFMGVR